MSLMDQVREIGAAEAQVSEETVRAARGALKEKIGRATKSRSTRRRRRTWTGIGLGGLVAGTAVTAIVAGSVLAPPAAPSASAAVFEQAAAGAARSDVALLAGEFRRFETVFSWNARWDEDMPQWARFNNADPADAEATVLVEDRMTTYVPADQEDEWVRERDPMVVRETFGDARAEAETEWDAANPSSAHAGITRYPAGIAEAGGDGGTFEYRLDGADEYADMPDDVAGVIAWFSDRYEGEGDSNGVGHYFIETIGDVNVFNLAPAEARAGMLRAFATLEDVTVLRADGAQTTLRYERREADGRTALTDVTLDTENGYVVQVVAWPYGSDGTGTNGDGSAGWSSRTVVEVSVVDSAP